MGVTGFDLVSWHKLINGDFTFSEVAEMAIIDEPHESLEDDVAGELLTSFLDYQAVDSTADVEYCFA